jgi:hypothetical protein
MNQRAKFPLTNDNVGNGVAPLLTNVPVAHWTMLFRPQMWGFFLGGRETAFALNWNFKWFGLLLGAFLFLRVISAGNDFLALAGALLLLFSAYVQWFFSSPTCMPEIVAMFFFGLWSLHRLSRTPSRAGVIAMCAVLLFAILQFVFCCYPRFQIPLLYLAAALAIAQWKSYCVATDRAFRITALGLTLTLAAVLLWQWQREIAPTVREIQSLIYPGQAFSTGGGVPWYFFFAPFLEFSLREEHFPAALPNVCEASGFLFLAPLLAAACARDIWRRRTDPILLATVCFLAGAILFMTCGVPAWLARITALSHLSPMRCLLAVGVASIIGTVRYLARDAERRAPLHMALLLGLILFACLWMVNAQLANFAPVTEIVAAALFFSTVAVLLWQRAALAAALLLVVPCIAAYGLVNPVNQGLPGITQSETFRWFSRVHERDPAARWIVTGNFSRRTGFIAQLIKATGAEVLGGTRCMPDRKMLAVLDPEDRFRELHDRYARVWFPASDAPGPAFELQVLDAYFVRLPFSAELFRRLDVTYVLVVDDKTHAALPGFTRVRERHGCILLRRDQ